MYVGGEGYQLGDNLTRKSEKNIHFEELSVGFVGFG